jgi:hypothetical protein
VLCSAAFVSPFLFGGFVGLRTKTTEAKAAQPGTKQEKQKRRSKAPPHSTPKPNSTALLLADPGGVIRKGKPDEHHR